MEGHFADKYFKNPNGTKYKENFGRAKPPTQQQLNREENCRLCKSKMHLAPACDVYPKAIIVAESCQHCLREYHQSFFHVENICMLNQRRKALAEPSQQASS